MPHEAELNAFATALATGDAALPARRFELQTAIGDLAFFDAAAVAAAFHGYVRVAEGTGIPVEELVIATSNELRDELGVNAFAGSANSTLDVQSRPVADFDPRLTR